MKIKFTLNLEMDAKLIERIEIKANGGSINEAAKFLFRFWHEQEIVSNGPLGGQKVASTSPIEDLEDESKELNFNSLDGLNLEF